MHLKKEMKIKIELDSFEFLSVFVLWHKDSAVTMISHHHVDCASKQNNCFSFSITYDKTQHAIHFDGQLYYYRQVVQNVKDHVSLFTFDRPTAAVISSFIHCVFHTLHMQVKNNLLCFFSGFKKPGIYSTYYIC